MDVVPGAFARIGHGLADGEGTGPNTPTAVSIVAADGRRRSFEVEIEPGGKVKKVWDFDRMEWR